ncbi:MAG: hypothetical protein ACREFU_10945 [Acetobacteraceae bacterium]
MEKRRLTRPSLKITRCIDEPGAPRFSFEIWNPFVGAYQAVDSVEDGLKRVAELARLIARMWLQRHPKRILLTDAPDADPARGDRWAEFRVDAMTFASYDTRYDGRTAWTRAQGLNQAAATTFAHVGYVREVAARAISP